MDFALLGDDPAVLPLVRAIAAHSQHRLTRAALVGETLRGVLEVAPSVEVSAEWEDLLDDPPEAIIVAGADPGVLEGARQLAADGRPLIVFPHPGQGAAFVYELTLIRDDTQGLLFPVFLKRVHPLVTKLKELLAEGRIGKLLHLQFGREVQTPARPEGPPLLTRADIDGAFLPDVDLLRNLGGDYDRVTALHSGRTDAGVAIATATLAGQGLPEALWSLRPTAGEPQWKLTLTGEQGTMELGGGGELSEMRLRTDGLDLAADPSAAVFDAGDAVLARFEAAAGSLLNKGDRHPPALEVPTSAQESREPVPYVQQAERVRPDWTDLTRAFETVEAAHRSVARRRTIDLHFETTSERSQFKTQMTAIGCGVLVLTLFAVVVLLMAGALLPVNPAVMRIAWVLVFLPLFLFLALQFLLLVSRPSAGESPPRQ